MSAAPPPRSCHDDPLKLRELLHRACHLASDHAVTSVMVGMAGSEGDRLFPDMVSYVGSALRIDDSILRLTRERAIFCLADADRARAEEIMARVLLGFREQFPTAEEPDVSLGFFEVRPDTPALAVKEVLPVLFSTGAASY